MTNLQELVFQDCFKHSDSSVVNSMFMGLNRRNKPLKLLKLQDSVLHPNSYYNLTALLQSGLLQGSVIFSGNVFVEQ